MLKKTFYFIFLLCFFNLFFIKKNLATEAYITGCLQVVSIYPCYGSLSSKYSCLNESLIDFEKFSGKKDHIAKIEGNGFPTGENIYIVGCISTTSGIKCTTGDNNLNSKVSQIGFTVVDNIQEYEFKAETNPIKSQNGSISILVRSYSKGVQDHLFFGVAPITEEEYTGSAKTITYGTFGFSDDPKKCISIHWDPKGRVFDSVSLEPLPGAEVLLLDNNYSQVNIIGVDNPFITKDDGLFNFFVPNGTYYLNPQKTNYQFPLKLTEINKKYSNIYYCDSKVGLPIYIDKVPIIEESQLIHCDIPLKPLGSPYYGEVKALEYGYMVLGDSTKLFGRFSHPYTLVNLKQNNIVIEKITADRFGNWEVNLINSKISSTGGEIEAEGIKNPIYFSSGEKEATPTPSITSFYLNLIKKLLSKIIIEVNSESIGNNKIIFNPILKHIEGYAYNNKGEIIPKAVVNVITQMDGKIYVQTQADEKGFFRIFSSQLPIFPYYLEIIDPKNPQLKNTMNTSQFIRLNKEYLITNNINLLTATKNNQIIATTTPLLKNTINPTLLEKNKETNFKSELTNNQTQKKDNQTTTTKNLVLLIVVILFLLILVVGGLIFYYFKKKETLNNSLS